MPSCGKIAADFSSDATGQLIANTRPVNIARMSVNLLLRLCRYVCMPGLSLVVMRYLHKTICRRQNRTDVATVNRLVEKAAVTVNANLSVRCVTGKNFCRARLVGPILSADKSASVNSA